MSPSKNNLPYAFPVSVKLLDENSPSQISRKPINHKRHISLKNQLTLKLTMKNLLPSNFLKPGTNIIMCLNRKTLLNPNLWSRFAISTMKQYSTTPIPRLKNRSNLPSGEEQVVVAPKKQSSSNSKKIQTRLLNPRKRPSN